MYCLRIDVKAWRCAAICALLVSCSNGDRGPSDTDGDSFVDTQDCASNDPARWQSLNYQSLDGDGDGHFVNSSGSRCSGASLPGTHLASTVPAASVDCNDANAGSWQLLSYVAVDTDLDGFRVASSGQICSGTTLPAGFATLVPTSQQVDCDDGNASSWRFATQWSDVDNDGIGSGSGMVACIGAMAGAGFSLYGYDPNPSSTPVSNVDLPSWLMTVP
jgi:hypothetical protein